MKSLNFTRNIFSILVLAFTFLIVGSVEGQVMIAGWDFQTMSNGGSAVATSPNCPSILNANFGSGTIYCNGQFGSSSWVTSTTQNELTSFAGTTLNSGIGFSQTTSSPASLALLGGGVSGGPYLANGKSIIIRFSMSGLKDLVVSFATQKTSTGFNQTWQISGDGTSWSNVSNITPASSFSVVTLPMITSVNNDSEVFLKVIFNQASSNSGNNRIDNLQLNASPSSFWTGSNSSDPTVAANWSPAAVPASTASVVIPTGLTNYPSFTNNSTPSFASITIDAGASLTLQSGSELTLTGNLTNNGTLTLENNATIVQGASSTLAGSGTYNVKQTITGGNNGSSPNGRFWYLGSPVSGGLSSILDAAGANIVKYWDEQSASWIEITDNTSALTVGRGHYLRSYTPGNQDLVFTGGSLNNGAYTFNVTANGSSFNGFNLVSNPYASYLKWDDVTKTNVGSTIWYRTSNGTNNMVFDTYNSKGNVGTSNNGNGTVSQFIPPMQAFWVKVEGSTTGSIAMDNLDRSHHISGMQGMHSMDSKLMFANLSLEKDSLRDQAIVYCSYETTDAQDVFDSEKMIQAGSPQLYSKIGDKKMVINAKNFIQRNEATPLYININNAGTHTIKLGEFNSTFGSIWLEDKTTQQFQNLLINDTYTFESQVGQDIARFVLHFGYPNQFYGSTEATDQPNNNPDEVINWADVSLGSSGSKVIELTANLNETEALQTKTMAIFDMTGRQVLTQSFESGNTQVYIPNANGVYLVQVQIGNTQKVFKVLIQE